MSDLQRKYRQMLTDLDEKDSSSAVRADSFSFIVRVWKESSAAVDVKPAGWRGSIEQVGLNQRVYVHNLESILAFIQEQTGMQVERPHSALRLWRGLRRWWTTTMTRKRNE
jgi:hypothetical protein